MDRFGGSLNQQLKIGRHLHRSAGQGKEQINHHCRIGLTGTVAVPLDGFLHLDLDA